MNSPSRRIRVSEVFPNKGDADIDKVGLLARIDPPVDLNPEAVQRTVTQGNLDINGQLLDVIFKDALVLGSTSERTSIYVQLYNPGEYLDEVSKRGPIQEELTERLQALLSLTGVVALSTPGIQSRESGLV